MQNLFYLLAIYLVVRNDLVNASGCLEKFWNSFQYDYGMNSEIGEFMPQLSYNSTLIKWVSPFKTRDRICFENKCENSVSFPIPFGENKSKFFHLLLLKDFPNVRQFTIDSSATCQTFGSVHQVIDPFKKFTQEVNTGFFFTAYRVRWMNVFKTRTKVCYARVAESHWKCKIVPASDSISSYRVKLAMALPHLEKTYKFKMYPLDTPYTATYNWKYAVVLNTDD